MGQAAACTLPPAEATPAAQIDLMGRSSSRRICSCVCAHKHTALQPPPPPPPARPATAAIPHNPSSSLCDDASGLSGLRAGGDASCYLMQPQQSAKSFSAASQRKQLLEQAERLEAAAAAARGQAAAAAALKYDSINQFSQRVELYRGRCAVSRAGARCTVCQQRRRQQHQHQHQQLGSHSTHPPACPHSRLPPLCAPLPPAWRWLLQRRDGLQGRLLRHRPQGDCQDVLQAADAPQALSQARARDIGDEGTGGALRRRLLREL